MRYFLQLFKQQHPCKKQGRQNPSKTETKETKSMI